MNTILISSSQVYALGSKLCVDISKQHNLCLQRVCNLIPGHNLHISSTALLLVRAVPQAQLLRV